MKQTRKERVDFIFPPTQRTIVTDELQAVGHQADHFSIEPAGFVHAGKSTVYHQHAVQLSASDLLEELGAVAGLGLDQFSEGGKRIP